MSLPVRLSHYRSALRSGSQPQLLCKGGKFVSCCGHKFRLAPIPICVVLFSHSHGGVDIIEYVHRVYDPSALHKTEPRMKGKWASSVFTVLIVAVIFIFWNDLKDSKRCVLTMCYIHNIYITCLFCCFFLDSSYIS